MRVCFFLHLAAVLAFAVGARADIVVREGAEWKPSSSPVPTTIIPGSILDLSADFDDRFDRLSIRNGHFVDAEGRPVRLFSDAEVYFRRVHGFKERPPEFDTPERIDAFCKELKRRGFNMVRAHMLDSSLMRRSQTDFQPLASEIDTFCRFVEALNRNRIYLNLDIAGTQVSWYAGYAWTKEFLPGQKGIGKRRIYVSEESRQAWARGCRFLFNIQNPYTGRKLRDEPCMALAVAYNEQEFGFSRPGSGYDDCAQIYRDWLKKEYGDIARLNAARRTSYPSFEEVPVFKASDYSRMPVRGIGFDVHRFMDDAQVSLTEKYVRWFREACPDGFISNWNMAQDLRQMSLRKYCDYVSINCYHAHPFPPSGYTKRNGGTVPADVVKACEAWSTIGKSARLARKFAACRLQGKPFVVTEYSICWWCRHRYEMGFVMGAYSALQGWDCLTAYSENAMISEVTAPLKTFEQWRDPVALAENFVTALAFRRSDVKESDLKIRWTVNRDELLKSPHLSKSLSDAQSEFSLVGSVALAVDEPPDAGAFSMKAASGSEVLFWEEGFQDAAAVDKDAAQKNAGRNIAERLRASGKLSKENATDPVKGVFESSTGEILLEAPRAFMRVETPRLQGICGRGGTEESMRDFAVKEMSRDGNLFVAARDGVQPISKARRLVVGYVTDVQNTGLTLADEEGCFLKDYGKLPILYATGRFKVAVSNENAESLHAWAVGNNGARLAELPLVRRKNTVLLAVDTAALPCGPVFFFELAEK